MQKETELFKNFSPYDRYVYLKAKVTLKKVEKLSSMWKSATSFFERETTKKLLIKLLNDDFETIPKTCGFLGVISPSYTLKMLKKDLEAVIEVIMENYSIEKPKTETDNVLYLLDDLEIWRLIKN